MNREQQEMALWREAYQDSHCFLAQERARDADAAVAEFRKRYPVEPTAPEPTAPELTWHDEPPFAGEYYVEGLSSVCWVEEDVVWYPAWDRAGDRPRIRELPRNGRRVCPVVKPPEPTP